MNKNLLNKINQIQAEKNFSGTVFVQTGESVIFDKSFGYANRAEKIENQSNTRYGIASGSKILTAIAIAQLVEQGKVTFNTRLKECLNIHFPHFDESITIHQLLTHTSGIPDYFDEEVMDDFEELWIQRPMYHIRRLRDFLPMFELEAMKSQPGSMFHYNNAGYILLGLVVEELSGVTFTDYVEKNIFKKCSMDAGYFEMDSLPERTALGYIDLPDGKWKTNVYSLPAKGGSDGGAFVTAKSMAELLEALLNGLLLNKETTNQLLTPHASVNESISYGYGIWMKHENRSISKYYLMGYDPGVNFRAAFYPETNTKIVICSNQADGAFDILTGIEDELNIK
ncbi:serine hydrolase domain-containing protein [Bacillus sp. 31A1R]|uniref:Serine hydrolase domain-containing protein n=1 Tax=Robertmurraya mangrovi TaxID=3098077 RepID=A0ABU5J3L7_9BACI|nr:serine hydrolase domain-containing protein [Bacillus sp. 31A1R]MDZ5474028.1 serine hydrolase domain-containing protein [Bacillus sp. 31A1R]